ncbi:MAG: Eco47II family restriction endonuclease [Flavobacteriales bacterium]|nr:Eco47II family restriction endonuclease [Flavobacteriales bacterium]
MAKLNWISDGNLNAAVSHLLEKAKAAKSAAEKEFGKNVIDPFSALFEIAAFELNYDDWKKSETARQAQKTLQNHVGEFHQRILGSVDGWENLEVGNEVDLANHNRKIIAEIKNKYNTMKGSDKSGLYHTLDDLTMRKSSKFRGYTAYYVTIIPNRKAKFNKLFTPSDKSKGAKCPPNELIREIDGASFYDLATGVTNSLKELFEVLPSVVSEVSEGKLSVSKEEVQQFFAAAYGVLEKPR